MKIVIILSDDIVISKMLGTCGYVQFIFQTGFISPRIWVWSDNHKLGLPESVPFRPGGSC